MGRQCKCAITGEIGNTDVFVKVGTKYYKNQETYDESQRKKESYKQLVDYICKTFLDYYEGQPFPPALPKFLKELNFYDSDTIFETVRQNEKEILYWFTNKQFNNQNAKLAYMFAIVKSKIADVHSQMKRQKAQEREAERRIDHDFTLISTGTKVVGKNISQFLEDDEL